MTNNYFTLSHKNGCILRFAIKLKRFLVINVNFDPEDHIEFSDQITMIPAVTRCVAYQRYDDGTGYFIFRIQKNIDDEVLALFVNDQFHIYFDKIETIKQNEHLETEVMAISLKKGDSFKIYVEGTKRIRKKIYTINRIYKGDFLREPGNVLFILDNCKQMEMKSTDFVIKLPETKYYLNS